MSGTDIVLERETANDESALIVAIHILSGSAVEADALIFDIENSKATQELRAPTAGVVVHDLQVGDVVKFGIPLARIMPSNDHDDPDHVVHALPVAGSPLRDSPIGENAQIRFEDSGAKVTAIDKGAAVPARFSKAATALIHEMKLSPEQFETGFVTTRDVLVIGSGGRAVLPFAEVQSATRRKGAQASASTKTLRPPGGVAVTGRKRAEINALGEGAGATHLSVLGTTLGAISMRRPKGDFLQDRITDLVIYEAARLMRKYPNLNAHYRDGEIFRYEAVHAGMAIDRGGNLVVYGIEHADRLDFQDLGIGMSDAVARYMNDELSAWEMSRATFTVTDLSGGVLDYVLPLVPRGQSCILGITRTEPANFRLFAGFDHRVTEGFEVSAFLNELAGRVRSFSEREDALPDAGLCCGICDRSLAEATVKGRDKGMLKIVDFRGRESLCCASCWNGW
ncbi:2-oxo acid dehydrogenase subunit E2 [Beijerinckia sp. L45]|uniref:2-oxo acid dehydrogenase subunit E2 n=1 Tax=Beijerinckia sp. L45 TaxID=1641855 RepID=UPI00131BD140|nr:2-oxo acid dehydrogenase subunit E2 [Beijerinckia sp. L45]